MKEWLRLHHQKETMQEYFMRFEVVGSISLNQKVPKLEVKIVKSGGFQLIYQGAV